MEVRAVRVVFCPSPLLRSSKFKQFKLRLILQRYYRYLTARDALRGAFRGLFYATKGQQPVMTSTCLCTSFVPNRLFSKKKKIEHLSVKPTDTHTKKYSSFGPSSSCLRYDRVGASCGRSTVVSDWSGANLISISNPGSQRHCQWRSFIDDIRSKQRIDPLSYSYQLKLLNLVFVHRTLRSHSNPGDRATWRS